MTVKLSDFSLGTRPRYSLVVDEDVKKQTNMMRAEVRVLSRFAVFSKCC